MDVTALHRKKWVLQSNETIFREESVNGRARDEGEVDSPKQRIISLVFWSCVGAYFLYPNITGVMSNGFEWWNVLGFPVGLGAIALGVWTARKTPPTPWADLERFIFTDERIVALDTTDRIMDEISQGEFEDIIVDKRYGVSCIRPNDPELKRMFTICYLDDYDEIFEFVKATYKGPTS
jgi:hypothetical protein